MHRRLAAALGFLALLAVPVVAVPAAAAPPESAPPQADTAQERREAVVRYWTPERVRNARPLLPVLDDGGREIPTAKGGRPGGGGGTGGSTVTGALWTGSTDPGNVGATTGKVLFTMKGANYVCSGSVLDDGALSVVLTAGHCVHDGDGNALSWATNWMFVPAYHRGGTFSSCGTTLYGCWVADKLVTTGDWYAVSDFSDDIGFAVMGPGGKGVQEADLADTVGHQAISSAGSAYVPVSAFGYPAAGKYAGRDLIYCAGTATNRLNNGTAALGCDMTGGSSGGPWYASFNGVNGTAVSVNSHIYRSIKNVMFGPVFDEAELDAIDAAFNETAAAPTKTFP